MKTNTLFKVSKIKKKAVTANSLTKAVVDFVNLQKYCVAWRVNSVGIFDPKTKRYRTSNTRKGVADISVIAHGLAIQIEIKIGKDKQSEHQVLFEKDVKKAKGEYWIVKSFDAFGVLWENFIKKRLRD